MMKNEVMNKSDRHIFVVEVVLNEALDILDVGWFVRF